MSLTRRDLLAAFLGVPFAEAACTKKKRIPDGELAFRPETLGHRLRDEPPPQIGEDRWQRASIVIVGGGVAGLAAAWRLRERGHEDFVLLELEGAAGGTARGGDGPVSAHPWGAHYITAPMKENVELLQLLRGFGVVVGEDAEGGPIFSEAALCREPQERVFAQGQWFEGLYLHEGETDADRRDFERFRDLVNGWVSWRDGSGRRAFALPTAEGSKDPAVTDLDRISMSEWLAREGLSSERLRWLVDYACRDDFGARAAQTSAYAALHYFASRLTRPGSDPQPVLTWPEGNGWLVARLLERVRANVRVGLAVADIAPTDDGTIDVVAIGRGATALGLRAKQVVFAAPQMVAQRVLRPWRDAPPTHLGSFQYGAWMVANITLSARPRVRVRGERMMAWDNVLYDSPSLGYVDAAHQSGRDHGPTVITYYHPLCDDDPRSARKRLYAADRGEWADIALADLERVHPDIRELATRLDVVRWGHAMARPSPGFLFGGAREAAARPFRGVHFAHTDLSGIALFEEAFFHGTRAADAALAAVRTEGT